MYHLCKELGIKRGDLISIIGSGGKTSLMFQLARRLCNSGESVVTTITTRMEPLPAYLGAKAVLSEDFAPERPCCDGLPFVVGGFDKADGKFFGPSKEFINSRLLNGGNIVLAEADGSAKKALKLYRIHEPVFTGMETKVIAVVGMSALGKNASNDYIHRLSLLGRGAADRTIDEDFIETLLFMKNGYLDVAGTKAVCLVFNSISADGQLAAAVKLAAAVSLRYPFIKVFFRGSIWGTERDNGYFYNLIKAGGL